MSDEKNISQMKGDKRFIIRLVLVLSITTILSLLIYPKLMGLDVGDCAAKWFDAVAPLSPKS